MLNTFHGNNKVSTGKKERQTVEEITKLECVVDYNKNMGGIDRGDSIMHHYPAFSQNGKMVP